MDWNGQGYSLGGTIATANRRPIRRNWWEFMDLDGVSQKIEGPREFNHTLSTVINGLIGRGFTLMGLWEDGALI